MKQEYYVMRNQFNLLVDGRDQPYLSKNKKNITNFGLLTFLNFFDSMFLIHYFLFLDKTYNNQNQEGFIMSEEATGGVP